jgi:hypothetical protein
MVRGGVPQVLQFPIQQTIPVQIPIQTANGQTIIQTVHIPIQTLATALPNSGILQGGQFQLLQQPQMQQVSSSVSVSTWKLAAVSYFLNYLIKSALIHKYIYM